MVNSTNTPGDGVEWRSPTSKQSPQHTPKNTPKYSADIGVGALDTTATKLDALMGSMALLRQDILARDPPSPPPRTKNKKKSKNKSRKPVGPRGAANAGDGDGDGGSTDQSGFSGASVTAIAIGSMLVGGCLAIALAAIWRKLSRPSTSKAVTSPVADTVLAWDAGRLSHASS